MELHQNLQFTLSVGRRSRACTKDPLVAILARALHDLQTEFADARIGSSTMADASGTSSAMCRSSPWLLPLAELAEHLSHYRRCRGGRSAASGMAAALKQTRSRASRSTHAAALKLLGYKAARISQLLLFAGLRQRRGHRGRRRWRVGALRRSEARVGVRSMSIRQQS